MTRVPFHQNDPPGQVRVLSHRGPAVAPGRSGNTMYQLSVYIHIVSAMVWVGGMFFVALIAVPVARQLPPNERGALLSALGVKFRTVGWVAIVLLVVTGITNASFRGVTLESIGSGQVFLSSFGRLLAAKVVLVAVMIVISAIHDFVIGPASTRATERASEATLGEVERLRRQASWLARLNGLLALVVVGLGVLLVRGLPASGG
ncbi:MAG: DUF4149 domain-containing protein [Chloroflexi bacterium]|nr:DUF4149 domain-containing protein [Chloroflexota bacterium]